MGDRTDIEIIAATSLIDLGVKQNGSSVDEPVYGAEAVIASDMDLYYDEDIEIQCAAATTTEPATPHYGGDKAEPLPPPHTSLSSHLTYVARFLEATAANESSNQQNAVPTRKAASRSKGAKLVARHAAKSRRTAGGAVETRPVAMMLKLAATTNRPGN
jgi:hypothetical protein